MQKVTTTVAVTSAEKHPPIPPEQLKRWRRLLASERDAASRYRRIAYGETGEWRELLLRLAERELQHAGRVEDMLRAAGAPVGRFSRIDMRARLVLSAQVSRTARLFRRRLEPSERALVGFRGHCSADRRQPHARGGNRRRSGRPSF